MDSILELRPLLLRVFNEVEDLHTQLTDRNKLIKQLENTVAQLTKENEIYRKVVRMYDDANSVPTVEEGPANRNENTVKMPVTEDQSHKMNETYSKDINDDNKHGEEKKINLSKKGRSIEELAASRREYHREYRRRRKEGSVQRE